MKVDLEQYAIYLSNFFGVHLSELQIKNRKREVVDFRHMILTYFYEHRHSMHTTIMEISSLFNQNHATLLHAVKNVSNLRTYNKEYKDRWDKFFSYAIAFNLAPKEEDKQNYEFMDKHSL